MTFSLNNLRFLSFCLLFLSATTLLTACDAEAIPPTDELAISDEQAAEIVEAALAAESQGMATDISTATELAEEMRAMDLVPCGSQLDSNFTVNYNGDRGSLDYSGNLIWTPLCGPGGAIRSISLSRSAEGTYATTRLSSDDNVSGNWMVDNINGGTSLIVNGTYERNGQQTVTTLRNSNDFTTALSFEVTELSINKGNRRIESGIASFNLTGSGSRGQSVDVAGQVIFQGNGTALIIINGNQYEVSL